MTTACMPVPAALSVVTRKDRVLLVRRANPPDAGLWGFPGGRIEWGEPLAQAAIRELSEETGVMATPGEVLTALDVIDSAASEAQYHFVLVAVRCYWQQGDGEAGDDALEPGWFTLENIRQQRQACSADVERVAQMAFQVQASDNCRSE